MSTVPSNHNRFLRLVITLCCSLLVPALVRAADKPPNTSGVRQQTTTI